jgi:ADP-heptose:LPS heptosyltransferase
LDWIVTSDTSMAHLAGALARPTMVMLGYTPDWRWLLERKDSPWYPSMQLFRQKIIGQWKPVAEQVRDAIAAQVRSRAETSMP